jgi:TRAP-type transport system small permease protein
VSEPVEPAGGLAGAGAPQTVEEKISWATKKVFSTPVKVMMVLGCTCIMAMMLLVTADVTGRYVLKHPVPGADELVGLLLMCISACAFVYTQSFHAHVKVELILDRLKARVRKFFDLGANLIALSMLAIITWRLFVAARAYALNLVGNNIITQTLEIPFYPFLLILGFGFLAFGLVVLRDTLIDLIKVVKK